VAEDAPRHRTSGYAVAGGILAHETFDGPSRPILALHGISSTRKLWLWLHDVAPDLRLIAPDLRGRGDSIDHGRPGPASEVGRGNQRSGAYGIDAHVLDLIDLLNHIGLRRVHVVGMSLGAFVAVRLAQAFPSRVGGLTLVDGGLPMALPPGLTPRVLPQVFGGRLARLGRSWPDLETYRDTFCSEVAPLLARDDALLRDYLRHDLDDEGMIRLDGDALLADAEDVYFGPARWQGLDIPMHLLHAEWSLGVDSIPAYEPSDLRSLEAAGIPTTLIPGADHAACVMTRHGASVVAEELRRAVVGPTD